MDPIVILQRRWANSTDVKQIVPTSDAQIPRNLITGNSPEYFQDREYDNFLTMFVCCDI